jgi:hypothetical protein
MCMSIIFVCDFANKNGSSNASKIIRLLVMSDFK